LEARHVRHLQAGDFSIISCLAVILRSLGKRNIAGTVFRTDFSSRCPRDSVAALHGQDVASYRLYIDGGLLACLRRADKMDNPHPFATCSLPAAEGGCGVVIAALLAGWTRSGVLFTEEPIPTKPN